MDGECAQRLGPVGVLLGEPPQLLVHLGAAGVMQDRARRLGGREEGLDTGTPRQVVLEARPVPLIDRVDQSLVEVPPLGVHPGATIDQGEKDPPPDLCEVGPREELEQLPGLLQGAPVGDRENDQVCGVERVLGERLEIALGIQDHHADEVRLHEDAPEGLRGLRPVLEGTCIRGRRHEVDAVLAELDHPIEGAFRPPVLQISLTRHSGREPKHALDGRLVVQRDDQHRQILVEGAQVDGEVGGDRGLADTSLVGGDGDDRASGAGSLGGLGCHGRHSNHRLA